jgi:phosphate uptake regulator
MINNMAYFGVGLITLMFIIFVMNRKNKSIQELAPSILITTGIFFTFVGIAIGLVHFNADNVDKSLPTLLNGIKTAFWASATGVFFALVIKLLDIFDLTQHNESTQIEGMSIDDIVTYQAKQTEVLVEILRSIKSMHTSIAAQDESSLVSQISLLRNESTQQNNALRQEFRDFAETMAENNSKAFIEALKDVIKDFNDKISEQFGDNFKQLNQAVEKTVIWQENYRNQMTQSIETMTLIAAMLESQAHDYSIVVSNSAEFEGHVSAMARSLEEITFQREHLQSLIQSLVNFLESASDSLPLIGQKVDDMTERLVKGMNEATEEVQKQVTILDNELEIALKRSLEGLGQQLASLSNKFVQDYTPLTNKLREVVALASKQR